MLFVLFRCQVVNIKAIKFINLWFLNCSTLVGRYLVYFTPDLETSRQGLKKHD